MEGTFGCCRIDYSLSGESLSQLHDDHLVEAQKDPSPPHAQLTKRDLCLEFSFRSARKLQRKSLSLSTHATLRKGWREFKGQMNRGNRTESVKLPLKESLRGRVFRVYQSFLEAFQRFLEIFQRFSEVFSETLSEADFPLLPHIRVAP